jgi:hypothetical protein
MIGKYSHPLYRTWWGIVQRCRNENSHAYHRYGGRGIDICEEWRNSFDAFVAYVGERPSKQHSIDRIDNDKGYMPGNVRWATKEEQAKNTPRNVWIEINGVTKCLSDWSDIYGVQIATVSARIKRGWDAVSALTHPSIAGFHRNPPTVVMATKSTGIDLICQNSIEGRTPQERVCAPRPGRKS